MGFKTDTVVEAAGSAAFGQKITAGGAVGAAGGWFFSSEFAAVAGLVIAVVGLLINWHYRRVEAGFKREENARQQREHEARMRKLRGECHE